MQELNFTFLTTRIPFKKYAHGNKPGLKDPPSNNKCLSSKARSATKNSDNMENSDDESATGLTPLLETEEAEKVSC